MPKSESICFNPLFLGFILKILREAKLKQQAKKFGMDHMDMYNPSSPTRSPPPPSGGYNDNYGSFESDIGRRADSGRTGGWKRAFEEPEPERSDRNGRSSSKRSDGRNGESSRSDRGRSDYTESYSRSSRDHDSRDKRDYKRDSKEKRKSPSPIGYNRGGSRKEKSNDRTYDRSRDRRSRDRERIKSGEPKYGSNMRSDGYDELPEPPQRSRAYESYHDHHEPPRQEPSRHEPSRRDHDRERSRHDSGREVRFDFFINFKNMKIEENIRK